MISNTSDAPLFSVNSERADLLRMKIIVKLCPILFEYFFKLFAGRRFDFALFDFVEKEFVDQVVIVVVDLISRFRFRSLSGRHIFGASDTAGHHSDLNPSLSDYHALLFSS